MCFAQPSFAGVMEGFEAYASRDYSTALREFTAAAREGDAQSQLVLGHMYDLGQGVAVDERRAAQWYRAAADQNNGAAQLELGMKYIEGRGVPKDEAQAYFWFLLGSASGAPPEVEMFKEVTGRQLNQAVRAATESAAASWRPTLVGTKTSDANAAIKSPRSQAAPTAAPPSQPYSTGTGWAVSKSQILTNAHVVAGCSRVSVAGRAAARVQSVDSKSDLALLAVPSNRFVASLRNGRLRQGDVVTVVGYPLRGLLASGANVTTGNVSALAGMQNDSRFVQISAPVQPGNSGGPLLDSSGNVVGVVVSKLDAVKFAQLTGDIPQNVNFAVSLFTLQGFLEANAVDYQTAPSTKNFSTADVAEIGRRFTVLVECYK